jgi:hypothetical protein
MPGKPRGERALTDAERQARRRLRISEERKVADDALAFLLRIEDEDVRSMRWEMKKELRALQTQGRTARAFAKAE